MIGETFEGALPEKLPSYKTIVDWVEKFGLDAYNSAGDSLEGKEYAQVADESMMIGGEKLLATLGVAAAHQGRPLRQGDARVLGLAVAGSWTGEGVGEELEKAAQKAGRRPEYVVSDNAAILNKGARLCGFAHHHDISHSLGMHLERTYKQEPDFQAYVKEMSDVKFKRNMTKSAYLLPPTQRAIARFINLSGWVKWSRKMLAAHPALAPEEQSVFSFIPAAAPLIEELSEVMRCVELIEIACKHQGFSKKTCLQCRTRIEQLLMGGSSRMVRLGRALLDFFETEAALLVSDDTVRHNSSDIIESIFGTYKARKSPNKLHGVTPFVLFIPAQTQLSERKDAKSYLFKERLERIRLKDVADWAAKNLSPNQVAKRTATLGKAG